MRLTNLLLSQCCLAAASVVTRDRGRAVQAPAPSTFWYENIGHNNSAFFRNVQAYGAKGDGVTDDTAAIQKAISSGTAAGVQVYFPSGTYLVNSGLKNAASGVLIGDPTNKPIIKAGEAFSGTTLFTGPITVGLGDYFHEIKNIIFDSTAVAPTKSIVLVGWSLSQATELQNVVLNMPLGATGHTGLSSTGANSPLYLNDIHINGGGIGMYITDTHYHFKNIYFNNTVTGIKINQLLMGTGQGLRFEGVTTGFDTTVAGAAHFNLIDSSATRTNTLVSANAATSNSLVLENVIVDSTVTATVKIGATTVFTGSVPAGQAWVKGTAYQGSDTSPKALPGTIVKTNRSPILVNGTGHFHTVVPPTYETIPATQWVNVKDHGVKADGTTDDTAALQAVINSAAAAGQYLFFPGGNYIITDTVNVPVGSRWHGEVWSQLLAQGPKFTNAKSPHVMIRAGEPGDKGIIQFTDFVFGFRSLVPGAILLEVNAAGPNPGDVGFFNVHFPYGRGAASRGTGGAVHLGLHLTPTSSAYLENSWFTDNGGLGGTTNGAGYFVEAQGGTWLLGVGAEHSQLYQGAISKAKDVFQAVQISEPGATNQAPWAGGLLSGEPTYSWCSSAGGSCHMSLIKYVADSTNIFLYGNAHWDFGCSADTCGDAAILLKNNTNIWLFGVGEFGAKYAVAELDASGKFVGIAARAANAAGSSFNGFAPALVGLYNRS